MYKIEDIINKIQRNWICIEKEPTYVKICNERVAAMTQHLL